MNIKVAASGLTASAAMDGTDASTATNMEISVFSVGGTDIGEDQAMQDLLDHDAILDEHEKQVFKDLQVEIDGLLEAARLANTLRERDAFLEDAAILGKMLSESRVLKGSFILAFRGQPGLQSILTKFFPEFLKAPVAKGPANPDLSIAADANQLISKVAISMGGFPDFSMLCQYLELGSLGSLRLAKFASRQGLTSAKHLFNNSPMLLSTHQLPVLAVQRLTAGWASFAGHKGGIQRATSKSKEKLTAIGKAGAQKRWKSTPEKVEVEVSSPAAKGPKFASPAQKYESPGSGSSGICSPPAKLLYDKSIRDTTVKGAEC